MKDLVTINPARLSWCLEDFRVTKDELSHKLGIAPKTLEATTAGREALSFKQLQGIADFFGRGVLFFMDPKPVQDEGIHTVQFRTLRNKKPQILPEIRKLIERTEWQREVFLGLVDGEEGPAPRNTALPVYNDLTAKDAGTKARQWLGLAARQDIDTYRAALEKKGILIFRAQGYAGKWHWGSESPLLGFSLYFERFPVIVLKRAAWETQQAFTMMHELGHLILHRAGSIDGAEDFQSHERAEQEANQFAGSVLVPDDVLRLVDDEQRPDEVNQYDYWVRSVTQECGVSTEVVLIRLIDVGRLAQNEYDEYRQWRGSVPLVVLPAKGNRQYRHREPIHMFGERYVKTVLDALGEQEITLPKASSYLDNIKLKDIHELEQFYAGV